MENTLKNNAASLANAKLYLNDELADVRFLFNINDEIETIPANKANLAALSPVFHAMFFGTLKESKEVKIVDSSVGAFKEFLQFFYLGEVTMTMENIETVARLADKYDVLEYVNACVEYLQNELTLDKMCWGLQLALFIKNQPLTKFCEREIEKSTKEVFATQAFRRCEKSTLEHILRLSLTCSEIDVFNAVIEWAKIACEQDADDATQLKNVKNKLGDCFKSIQFGELKLEEFLNIHASYEGLFTLEEFHDIIHQIASTEYKSKLFDQSPRDFVWDDTKVMECKRLIIDSTARNVLSVEVVSFSTNQPLLLGEIWSSYCTKTNATFGPATSFGGFGATQPTLFGSSSFGSKATEISTRVNVAIIQLKDNTFHSNASPKNLYNGSHDINWSNGSAFKIVLPKPILIKSHTVYEIRIEKDPNCAYTYNATWNQSVKLDNGLEIYFHQNLSLGYDNSRTGWISTLKFNKL